jgi:hypothetical protein
MCTKQDLDCKSMYAFVFEFNNPKEHMDDKGEYIKHYPGVSKGKHPKGFGLPCCFKKPKQGWEFNQENVKKPRKKVKIDESEKNIAYIISNETFPIKQPKRLGFLPLSVQLFLQINSNDYITENNAALVKPNIDCVLRYGVEQTPNQSILGSIAELYAYTQGIDKTPSVNQLKQIIKKNITIDHYIRYHNSYLVTVFKPKKVNHEDLDIALYENTAFYKTINLNDENQVDFLEDTIASYENFMDFIESNESLIDHTYLWDMITEDNSQFIKGGVNLVILEIVNNDITDKKSLFGNKCRFHSPRRLKSTI